MEEKANIQNEIIEIYFKIIEECGRLPVYGDFIKFGISRDTIRYRFININNLHNIIKTDHLERLNNYILTEKHVFSNQQMKRLDDTISKNKIYIITTIVSGKKVFESGLSSIRNYLYRRGGCLLLTPCSDVWNRGSETNWSFSPTVKDDLFIFNDTRLNDNLFISAIRMSAKHINPTSGLSRIGQRNGSYIFASPKQYLEFVVNSSDRNSLPAAMMTTGAITFPDYTTDQYMSERVSYIAENDHVMGGLIVEVEDDQIFHFRQFQLSNDGSFIDLGIKYLPDGNIEKCSGTLIMGDYHAGETSDLVKEATKNMCEVIGIKDIFVHDMFDGHSINHYEEDKPLVKAKRALEGTNSLLRELEIGGSEFNFLHSIIPGNVYRVASNHDERIRKYLLQGKYVYDPENHYISLDLAKALLEGEDVDKYAYETYGKIDNFGRIIWLSRDEECKISGVEVGQHGDLGLNGSKASLNGVEKAYGNCVVGHSHSAAIMRGVYRVGTSTNLKLDYNKGPSSWTNTHCVIYDNGMRQLINIIHNKWCMI